MFVSITEVYRIYIEISQTPMEPMDKKIEREKKVIPRTSRIILRKRFIKDWKFSIDLVEIMQTQRNIKPISKTLQFFLAS